MAKQRFNFPCNCSAYKFPHRIGSGSCSGSSWAEFYFSHIKTACDGCNCTDSKTCDVSEGRESIFECEAADEYNQKGHLLIPCQVEILFNSGIRL